MDDVQLIQTYRGASWQCVIEIDDESNQPINYTGWDISFHIYAGTPDAPGAMVLERSVGEGVSINGNQISLSLSPTESADLPIGNYWAELLLTSPDELLREIAFRAWWTHAPTGDYA